MENEPKEDDISPDKIVPKLEFGEELEYDPNKDFTSEEIASLIEISEQIEKDRNIDNIAPNEVIPKIEGAMAVKNDPPIDFTSEELASLIEISEQIEKDLNRDNSPKESAAKIGFGKEMEKAYNKENISEEEEQQRLHTRFMAYSFGWKVSSGIFLDDSTFDSVYNVEFGDCVYCFKVMPSQQKTFRFPQLDEQIERKFNVQLEMSQRYLLVCNPGDEWQFTGLDAVKNSQALVEIIATNETQEANQTIFSHTIPIFMPDDMLGINLLCKPGCCYVVRSVNLYFPDEERLVHDKLKLPQIIEIPKKAYFAFQFYNCELPTNQYFIFKLMEDKNKYGNMKYATIRFRPTLFNPQVYAE